MASDYIVAGIMVIIALVFVGVSIFFAWLIRPKRPTTAKHATYECGEIPKGGAWVQYNVRFYLVALAFVVFDVEVAFLFPWAIVFKRLGLFGFIEMTVFISIILFGLIYVWRKGALKWV